MTYVPALFALVAQPAQVLMLGDRRALGPEGDEVQGRDRRRRGIADGLRVGGAEIWLVSRGGELGALP